MSPFWILLELRVMQVVVIIAALRHAKLQSSRHQQTNTQLYILQTGCPYCHPTNSVKAVKGNGFTISRICLLFIDVVS